MAQTYKENLSNHWEKNPLNIILLVALFIRLLASFFSEGYAFHDDHFDVIRIAESWAHGIPYWINDTLPPKHSMLYAGVNAVFIWLIDGVGITDSYVKTDILRIIHSFYSLLTIYFAYKITELLSNRKNAVYVGWMLAFLWFMPYLSVKFLAELVCVPPMLAAYYLIIKSENHASKKWSVWVISGALFAVAFSIRLHTVLFAGGMGIVMLFRKQWLESVLFSVMFLIVAFIIIGIPDIIFFKYPFESVVNYFAYNSENAYNYITGSPFKFVFTTIGFLVPPISLFLVFGAWKAKKVEPMMFVGVVIFFLVHSAFPNKQERFVLPMYPMLIILGIMGWNAFVEQSQYWAKHTKLLHGFWKFFWGINVVVAFAMALTFTKKDRVAPLHYLSTKGDVTSIVVESERNSVKQVPAYYYGTKCIDYGQLFSTTSGLVETVYKSKAYLDSSYVIVYTLGAAESVEVVKSRFEKLKKHPNYIVFKGDKDFETRLARAKNLFPGKSLAFDKEITPSNFDKLLHFLNPKIHRNNVARIYKVE